MNEVGAELAEKLDNYHGMSREARNDQQTTNDRYERIRLELLNREKLIEAQVNSSDQFMTALQELEMDLTGVDAAIADESVGSDSEELKRQLAELQVRIILTGNWSFKFIAIVNFSTFHTFKSCLHFAYDFELFFLGIRGCSKYH